MNYLNDTYINLDTIAKKYFEEYKNAEPFPHIVFDNFFNVNKLNDILNEFPSNLHKIGIKYDSDPEQKLASNNPDRLSKNARSSANRIGFQNVQILAAWPIRILEVRAAMSAESKIGFGIASIGPRWVD